MTNVIQTPAEPRWFSGLTTGAFRRPGSSDPLPKLSPPGRGSFFSLANRGTPGRAATTAFL